MGCVLLASLLPCHVHAHVTFRDLVPNGLRVPDIVALGHQDEKHGGGALNEFGAAFRDADYKWTRQLCEADSDGDGVTNGMELGDPCCMWSEGKTPLRAWQISHPGDNQFAARVEVNCSKIQLDNPFWDFYFDDPVMVATAMAKKTALDASHAKEGFEKSRMTLTRLFPSTSEVQSAIGALERAHMAIRNAADKAYGVMTMASHSTDNVVAHGSGGGPSGALGTVFLVSGGLKRRYSDTLAFQ